MRLMLISPRTVNLNPPESSWIPLGLTFMAAALRQAGHSVSIFDRHACQAWCGTDRKRIDAEMLSQAECFKPDMIGFSTVSPLIYDTAGSVELLRRDFPGMIVAGGYHATALPESMLAHISGLNGVVAGEGEDPICRLAAGESPGSIPGVWWKEKDKSIISTPPVQIDDLDRLPFPALDLLDMPFYTRPNMNIIRGHHMSSVALLTSRGCYMKCDFCCESLTYGRGVRFHSPAYVIEWIRQVLKNYGIEGIYFLDNNFLASEERAVKICEDLVRTGLNRKLKWACQARADNLKPEITKTLRRAGCVLVEIGVEAAGQKELADMHKGTTVEMNEKAIRLCRSAGMHVHAYMLTGCKGETVDDMAQRLAWLKKVKPTTFQWGLLHIYPGTPLYREKGEDFFDRLDWTEENVSTYFNEDRLSCVSREERQTWKKRHFDPYFRNRMRLAILSANSVPRLAGLFIRKARSDLLKRWAKLKGIIT